MEFRVNRWTVQICLTIALLFAVYLGRIIIKCDEGDSDIKAVAEKIKRGSNAFLIRQYKGWSLLFLEIFTLLMILSFMGYLSMFVTFVFVTGGLFMV